MNEEERGGRGGGGEGGGEGGEENEQITILYLEFWFVPFLRINSNIKRNTKPTKKEVLGGVLLIEAVREVDGGGGRARGSGSEALEELDDEAPRHDRLTRPLCHSCSIKIIIY